MIVNLIGGCLWNHFISTRISTLIVNKDVLHMNSKEHEESGYGLDLDLLCIFVLIYMTKYLRRSELVGKKSNVLKPIYLKHHAIANGTYHVREHERQWTISNQVHSTFFKFVLFYVHGLETIYRSTIAGSFKNNPKNKKRTNYEIMKTKKQK